MFADCGNFCKCISLWMYALKMQQSNKLMPAINHLTISSLLSFCELFHFLLTRRSEDRASFHLSHDLIVMVIRKCVEEILREPVGKTANGESQTQPSSSSISDDCQVTSQSACSYEPRDSTNRSQNCQQSPVQYAGNCDLNWQRINRVLYIILNLVGLSNKSLEVEKMWGSPSSKGGKVSYENVERSKLLHRIRNVVDHKGRTLLHLAAAGGSCTPTSRSYHIQPPNPVVIVLSLLHAGFDPNKLDKSGQTALHCAATCFNQEGRKKHACELFELLVEGGAHIDYADEEGKTPADRIESLEGEEEVRLARLKVKHTKLSCLAARQVRKSVRDGRRSKFSVEQRLGSFIFEMGLH